MLGLAGLLLSSAAGAEPVQEISVAVSTMIIQSPLRGGSVTAFEAAYQRPVAEAGLGRAVQWGGGLRTGFPFERASLPLEAFVRARLTARLGFWEVAAGPELGLTGFTRLEDFPLWRGGDLSRRDEALSSSLYLAFGAAPLRLRLGRFVVSLAEVQLGSSLLPAGATTRWQLGLVRLGGML
ncbi:hypothetical protein JRI60_39835 [Archangium violaceum]|uniref:hypothetical protein n=1 Tax=Archangium violaceum TaxID=83451 RepID=UPI00194E0BCE|nr:hypothetical protein [Archangium violaceum]QRN95175.1 hypothetical protein JRI60_39835 [Archangium violaceum]